MHRVSKSSRLALLAACAIAIVALTASARQGTPIEDVVRRVIQNTERLPNLRGATFKNDLGDFVGDIGHFGLQGRLILGPGSGSSNDPQHEVELDYSGLEVNWQGRRVAFLGKNRGQGGGIGQLSLAYRNGRNSTSIADGGARFFTADQREVVYVGIGTQLNREVGVVRVNGKTVADSSEVFELATRAGVVPGTVMSVTEQGNELTPAAVAYDPKVVGVISGAGGLSSGMQLGTREDGTNDLPIAMSGQVYVRVSLEGGPLEAGNLLVSSSRPGVAMRAADPARAFGAVIGKALEPFKGRAGEAEGLVRMLVMSR